MSLKDDIALLERYNAWVRGEEDTDKQRTYRSGTSGQQTRCGESTDDGFGLANSERNGWNEGRAESGGEQGRLDAAERSLPVADPGSMRSKIGISGQDEGKERNASIAINGSNLGLFAPSPSDARWADIIREHPELAPALEPTFRGMVNGLAFDMGDSRAARPKCAGNGVVALQASIATIVLARRTGILK